MSDPFSLDPATTAYLFMDYQNGILPRLGEAAPALIQRVSTVLDGARAAGSLVVFVRVGFRPGLPEISEQNLSFAAYKKGGMGAMLLADAPATQVIDALAPRADEPVVIKRRVGAFGTTDLEPILRARRIETLVLCGVATSGVVLSTVRHAADADYRLVVVSDGCADPDEEVHRVLMGKIFPRQATVATCADVVAAAGGAQARLTRPQAVEDHRHGALAEGAIAREVLGDARGAEQEGNHLGDAHILAHLARRLGAGQEHAEGRAHLARHRAGLLLHVDPEGPEGVQEHFFARSFQR